MGRLQLLGLLFLIVAHATMAQVPLPTLRSTVTPEGLTIWEIEPPSTVGETPFVFVVLLRSGLRDEDAASRGFTEDLRWALMNTPSPAEDPAKTGVPVRSSSRVGIDHVVFRFSGPEADWRAVIQHAASLLVTTKERTLVSHSEVPSSPDPSPLPPWIQVLQGVPSAQKAEAPTEAERFRHYERLFHPERLVLAWSGRTTSDRVTLAIRTAFHGLPHRAAALTASPDPNAEAGRTDLLSDGAALAYQVACTRPEQYLSLLVMEHALEEAIAESTPIRSYALTPASVWRDFNVFGTPFLAAMAPDVDASRSGTVQEALSDCFASLRDLTPEDFENLRQDLVDALLPRDAAHVETLAIEGLRLAQAGDGRMSDVLHGLKQLRYADFRDTVKGSLAAGRALSLPTRDDDNRALFLVVYGISLALLLFLLLDAWLGMRLFRNLRSSLRRPKPAEKEVPVFNRRSQTEQLVREIQSWYREQDRLRERPDHRD